MVAAPSSHGHMWWMQLLRWPRWGASRLVCAPLTGREVAEWTACGPQPLFAVGLAHATQIVVNCACPPALCKIIHFDQHLHQHEETATSGSSSALLPPLDRLSSIAHRLTILKTTISLYILCQSAGCLRMFPNICRQNCYYLRTTSTINTSLAYITAHHERDYVYRAFDRDLAVPR